ncbi:hypothetical protein PRIPAC_90074 [Pristionchus pacificus]|uniref:Uncharacterized protein n=1 Tax=Pristionchus pacificus TaxID=54126 RepID=A0A2A6CYF3_PRIPA|nr:hypothetical protein PRIPAC_90074 [Pristionchus pacificus]|eukprot:PDM83116.1 hypothetical protein PRIPAC_37509 [Pristionchus pacificus]
MFRPLSTQSAPYISIERSMGNQLSGKNGHEAEMGRDYGLMGDSFRDTDLLLGSTRIVFSYTRLVSAQSEKWIDTREEKGRHQSNLIVASICCQRFAN